MHKDIIRNMTYFSRIGSLNQFSRHSFQDIYFINRRNKYIQNNIIIQKQILLLKFHEVTFALVKLVFKLQIIMVIKKYDLIIHNTLKDIHFWVLSQNVKTCFLKIKIILI